MVNPSCPSSQRFAADSCQRSSALPSERGNLGFWGCSSGFYGNFIGEKRGNLHGGVLKWRYPSITDLNRVSHYINKPSIRGYHHLWKPTHWWWQYALRIPSFRVPRILIEKKKHQTMAMWHLKALGHMGLSENVGLIFPMK